MKFLRALRTNAVRLVPYYMGLTVGIIVDWRAPSSGHWVGYVGGAVFGTAWTAVIDLVVAKVGRRGSTDGGGR